MVKQSISLSVWVECFFWAPSKNHTYSLETEGQMIDLAKKYLPDNLLEEKIETCEACQFYVAVSLGSNEEKWFVASNDNGEYYFDDDWFMAHGFDTREKAFG